MKIKYPLYYLTWNVTNKCNLNCMHCYANSHRNTKEKELTTEEAKNLIDESIKIGLKFMLFTGGEPLLRKDLLFKLANLLKENASLVLVTNGFLIEKQDIGKIKKYFNRVQISLYSLKKDLLESINGAENSFDKILNGINLLIKNNVPVVINFVLTNLNFSSFDGVYKFVKKKGLKLRVLRYRGYKYTPKNNLNDIYKKYKNDKEVFFDEGFNFLKKGKCGAIKNIIAISSSGGVYPCTWLRKPSFKLGNVCIDDLDVLLNNEKSKNLRRLICSSVNINEACPFFIKSFK